MGRCRITLLVPVGNQALLRTQLLIAQLTVLKFSLLAAKTELKVSEPYSEEFELNAALSQSQGTRYIFIKLS